MSSSRVPGVLGGLNQPPFQSTGVGRPVAVARSAQVLGAGPQSGSTFDRVRCVERAYRRALMRAPSAIYQETGYRLEALIEGLLPGLLQVLIVLVAGTVLGAAGGAALGALAGGLGAAPGAVLGAQAGMDLGVALLGWLGLGALALSMAQGIGPLYLRTSRAVMLAWEAAGTTDEHSWVSTAGDELAQAVAELLRLLLMAIVAYLSRGAVAGATARSAGSLGELVGALRQSRFGAGFAQWVGANAATLMRDPRLRGKTTAAGSTTPDSSVPLAPQSTAKMPSPAAKPPPETAARVNEVEFSGQDKIVPDNAVMGVRAGENGGLSLFKWGKDTTTKPSGWKEGDFMLHLPGQGSAKVNWAQNVGLLREQMRQGNPIYDSYRDAFTGQQIPTQGFLRAERNLLESRGWQYNSSTGAYHPPGQ